jgi:hypothetical protein
MASPPALSNFPSSKSNQLTLHYPFFYTRALFEVVYKLVAKIIDRRLSSKNKFMTDSALGEAHAVASADHKTANAPSISSKDADY